MRQLSPSAGLVSLLFVVEIARPSLAQITPAADGTGTLVNLVGGQFTITGGTTSGTNLFHSFQQFGLTATQTANFSVSPAIQTILGRVTGGDASIINGGIQVTGSNANLYLMNPAGIVFGSNASLNVPATFTATTANGIGFSGGWFSASGSNNYATLTGEPQQLAFTMDQPGAIVNHAPLTLGFSQNLVLAGGTVANPGAIGDIGTRSGSGKVLLTAVPGSRLVRINLTDSPLSLEIEPTTGVASLPNAWALPILSLPNLLTGGGAGNANGLTVDGSGQVMLTGSGASITPGDVVTQDLVANGVTLAAAGSVKTGHILTSNDFVSGVRISATTGDVIVNSIDSGTLGIDIFAAGQFQARGTVAFPGYSTGMDRYIDFDSQLLPFLVSKTGATAAELEAVIRASSPFAVRVQSQVPVSVRSIVGEIRIRFGGGTGSPITLSDGVTLQGESPFVLGPRVTAGSGDRYLPFDPTDNFATFATSPFSLRINETYGLATLPVATSGTVGAITRTVITDGSFVVSIQDRVFNPVVPGGGGGTPGGGGSTPGGSPGSSPGGETPSGRPGTGIETSAAQTIERQLTQGARPNPCETPGSTGGRTRSPQIPLEQLNQSLTATTATPCANPDDSEILKILEGGPTSERLHRLLLWSNQMLQPR